MQKYSKNSSIDQHCTNLGTPLHNASNKKDIAENIQNNSYLVLKNIPQSLTTKGLSNLCSTYGSISYIKHINKSSIAYINTPSFRDIESICRGLLKNDYGIQPCIRHKFIPTPIYNKRLDEITDLPSSNEGINVGNREYCISSKQHPRPEVIPPQLFMMPIKENLVTGDIMILEKDDALKPIPFSKMSEKTKAFIDKKRKQSIGTYSPLTKTYSTNEPMPNFKHGFCYVCKRKSCTYCSRCSLYYCSNTCQINDWPNHRFKCGKEGMNSTLSSPNILNNSGSMYILKQELTIDENNDNIPSSGDIVRLVSVSMPNVLFIRSKSRDVDYIKVMNYLQIIGNNLEPLKNIPQVGEIVIALRENLYNRAQVLNIKKEKSHIVIHYIDYGTLDYAEMANLYIAPEECVRIPRYAIPVILRDIPDCYMTKEICSYLNSYLINKNLKIDYDEKDYVDAKGAYIVRLTDEDTGESINENVLKLAVPTIPEDLDCICFKNYLELKALPTGNNVDLIVMDNSLMNISSISCTSTLYALEIQKFQKDIQRYGESTPPSTYAPRVNELCIAKYNVDNKWYRGFCLELVGDAHPSILFLDYGNIAYIHVDNIRPYPPQFTFPIFTFDCEIEGLPEQCNSELVEKLEELIPNGNCITCDEVKKLPEDGSYSIRLEYVLNKLTEQHLLQTVN